MSQEPAQPDRRTPDSRPEAARESQSPLSLSRLRAAFAEMLNPHPRTAAAEPSQAAPQSTTTAQVIVEEAVEHDPCEINPRSVVEAILFVGHPDNRSFSGRELAAAMRGVSPAEIDAAVAELNAQYAKDAAPYQIAGTSAGYRLALRDDFGRMRDKFQGRVREAKLSAAAVEVLSIVAYNQPITADDVSQLRGAASGGALATLVRRKLIRLDRPADSPAQPRYSTTERFLRLFGLESIAALPRSEELEKA